MNVTQIEFHDAEASSDYMGNPDGDYSTQFIVSVDGTDYAGIAIYDRELCAVEVEW